MEFTADQVWGAAVAADRINSGYFKEPVFEEGSLIKHANKAMIKDWLRTGNFALITEEDLIKGQEVRNYIKTYLMRQLTGQINDFEAQALKLANREEFTGKDLFEFAVISSLPNSVRLDKKRADIKREIWESEPLIGDIGAAIMGELVVMSSRWSVQYGKFRIVARFNESVVDFWTDKEFPEGSTVKIKAKIKAHREDNTTQLNYVKKA
jgi:hypothetical protein